MWTALFANEKKNRIHILHFHSLRVNSEQSNFHFSHSWMSFSRCVQLFSHCSCCLHSWEQGSVFFFASALRSIQFVAVADNGIQFRDYRWINELPFEHIFQALTTMEDCIPKREKEKINPGMHRNLAHDQLILSQFFFFYFFSFVSASKCNFTHNIYWSWLSRFNECHLD